MGIEEFEHVISYDRAVVSRGQRGELVPCSIQPRDLDVLEAVRRCKFLTTPQLLELWWPGVAPQVGRRRLTKLFEAGYLDRFRPVARRGSFPWTYQLGREGHRLLQRAQLLPANERFELREVYDYRYVLHEVHLCSWVIAWRRLLGERLVSWDGETQIDPPSTRALQGRVDERRTVDGLRDASPKQLRPDAKLEIARRDGRGLHTFLVEYDRTRRVDKNFEKFRRYDTFATAWWRQTDFAAGERPPWILFVCQDADQRDRFLAQADREVLGYVWADDDDGSAPQFPGRRRMLFVSEEDVYRDQPVGRRLPVVPPGHPARAEALADHAAILLPGSEGGPPAEAGERRRSAA